MPFYAPTVNAYKRYLPGSWAPSSLTWGYDNRTVAFRIVGQGEARRIECRLPGADCNPYLAYAATLASGLAGIADQIEPPPAVGGDGYLEQGTAIPADLVEATDAFAASSFARETFGDEVVGHYAHFFVLETAAFAGAVTDWERRRYYERI